MPVVSGEGVKPSDVWGLHSVEHHVHGSNAQHGLIGVKAGEHGAGVVLLVLHPHQLGGAVLGNIPGGGTDKAGGAHGRVADVIFQGGVH